MELGAKIRIYMFFQIRSKEELDSTKTYTPVSSLIYLSLLSVRHLTFVFVVRSPFHSVHLHLSVCPSLSLAFCLPTNNASQPRCFYGPVPTIYSLRLENTNFCYEIRHTIASSNKKKSELFGHFFGLGMESN